VTKLDPTSCIVLGWGTYQYSDEFVSWLAAQHDRDNNFFASARTRHYDLMHG
jgi:hypothetical protein